MTKKLDVIRERYTKHVSIPCGVSAHAEHIKISQELKEINPDYQAEFLDECREALRQVREQWRTRLEQAS
jgi:hypothetical protein